MVRPQILWCIVGCLWLVMGCGEEAPNSTPTPVMEPVVEPAQPQLEPEPLPEPFMEPEQMIDPEEACNVQPTGGYQKPEGDACDLIAQDCAEGFGCYLTQEGAQCAPMGVAMCNEGCGDTANDCAPGFACIEESCIALCEQGTECATGLPCSRFQGRDDVGVCVIPDDNDACDLVAQDCEGDMGCYPTISGARCIAAGAGALNDACSQSSDCGAGLLCAGPDEDDTQSCLELCDSGEQCEDDRECVPLPNSGNAGVCVDLEPCDLIAQNCGRDEGCYLGQTGPVCAPAPSDPADEGQRCGVPRGCAPGLLCVGEDESSTVCRAACDLQAPACAGARQCAPLEGVEGTGVCVRPPG